MLRRSFIAILLMGLPVLFRRTGAGGEAEDVLPALDSCGEECRGTERGVEGGAEVSNALLVEHSGRAQRQCRGAATRRDRWQRMRECVSEVVVPVVVVLLGVGFSVAALWVAFAKAVWPQAQ